MSLASAHSKKRIADKLASVQRDISEIQALLPTIDADAYKDRLKVLESDLLVANRRFANFVKSAAHANWKRTLKQFEGVRS